MKAEGGCWPTPLQQLLLCAALKPGVDALDAWRQWTANGGDIERLDSGSYRLLPLLYRNLRKYSEPCVPIEILRGVYRRTWYKNRMMMHQTARMLGVFRAASIETMMLKGAPLSLRYYGDPGLRPMADFDILVKGEDALAAMDLLRLENWRPAIDGPETLIPILHATGFVNGTANSLDLHWHLMPECPDNNADQGYWERSVPFDLEGEPTRTLARTDQLLHVCVHGASWNPSSPIRWVADAMMILGADGGQIEWDLLAAVAREHRLVLPLRDTLAYLQEQMGAPIPDETMSSLRHSPVSKMDLLAYRTRIGHSRFLGALPMVLVRYAVNTRRADFGRRVLQFPRYLQVCLGAPRLRYLPLVVAAKAGKRLSRVADW